MKLSKKLLALGLSVGLVVSSVVPVFAWNNVDALAGLDDVFASIEAKCYTAQEKAEIMAYAENVVNAWDDVVYGDGVLKLRDSRGTYWLVEYAGVVMPDGGIARFDGTLMPSRDGMGIISASEYVNDTFDNYYKGSGVSAKDRLGDYEDKVYSDFEALFHKLHFDALGRDEVLRIYEKENTNVTNIGDTLYEINVADLLDMWTHEGSLLDALNDSLSLAAICKDDKKADTANTATTTPTTTPTTTNCVTCNTTTTTTTTTTAAGTGNAGTGNAARPAAGLPLANTATNYGNVMALGLGAMVVALGVFAYSKKVTA